MNKTELEKHTNDYNQCMKEMALLMQKLNNEGTHPFIIATCMVAMGNAATHRVCSTTDMYNEFLKESLDCGERIARCELNE